MADLVVTNATELQSAMDSAVGDDTILVQNGDYITTNNGTDEYMNGGFTFANGSGGTSGHPITLKPYPGHAPRIANRAIGSTTWVGRPTITWGGMSHIVVDGLRVYGAIFCHASESATLSGTTLTGGGRGNVIKNCEVSGGWENDGDGNWCGIRLDYQDGAIVQNCYVHDIDVDPGIAPGSSTAGIKMFVAIRTLVEFCTVLRVVPETDAGGIDDKADSIQSTYRFNWMEDMVNGCRIQNQTNYPGSAADSTGTAFYQNVIILNDQNGRCFTQEAGPMDDFAFYNNTCIGTSGTESVGADDGLLYCVGANGATLYNNIFYGPNAYRNITAYTAGFSGGGLCNYNHYSDAANIFKYNSVDSATLAAWQASNGNAFDQNASSGDPLFTNLGAKVFTLQGGSPCVNTGKTGGTSGGSTVNKGAYITGSEQIGYSASGSGGGVSRGRFRAFRGRR